MQKGISGIFLGLIWAEYRIFPNLKISKSSQNGVHVYYSLISAKFHENSNKIAKLQMHENLHKNVFIHIFIQVFLSFYEWQLKQYLISMVFNQYKIEVQFF